MNHLDGTQDSADLTGKFFRGLRDPDPNVRCRTLESIVYHELKHVPHEVVEALTDPDECVRVSAAWTLSEFAHKDRTALKPFVSALIGAASDACSGVRFWVAKAVGGDFGSGAAPALRALVRLLGDKEASVRLMAALSLSRLGGDTLRVIESQEQYDVLSSNPFTRAEAALKLGTLGATALPKLEQLLKDEQAVVRRATAIALGLLAPEGQTALIDALNDDEFDVRVAAVRSLGHSKTSIPALIKKLQDDPDELVRAECADGLGRVGAEAKEAIAALSAAIQDSSTSVRRKAAIALREIGPSASSACFVLLEALRDTDADVREEVGRTLSELAQYSDADVTLMARLVTLFGDQTLQGTTRADIGRALTRIDAERLCVPTAVLVEGLRDASPDVRFYSAALLHDIAPDAKDAVEALINALHDSDEDVRSMSAKALAAIGPAAEAAQESLCDLLTDEQFSVRFSAAMALSVINPGSRLQWSVLVEGLYNGAPDYRTRAADLLGYLNDPNGLPLLTKVLNDENEGVRIAVARAIARIREASAGS